jgi:hypothetical protein
MDSVEVIILSWFLEVFPSKVTRGNQSHSGVLGAI